MPAAKARSLALFMILLCTFATPARSIAQAAAQEPPAPPRLIVALDGAAGRGSLARELWNDGRARQARASVPGTMAFIELPSASSAPPATVKPGTSPWRDPVDMALAELPRAIPVLYIQSVADAELPALESSADRRQCSLALLKAVRSAFQHTDAKWSASTSFFSLTGLRGQNEALRPFFNRGLDAAALVLPGSDKDSELRAQYLRGLTALALALEAYNPRSDRNYFEYPLPWGQLLIRGRLLAILLLALFGGSALALALAKPHSVRLERLRRSTAFRESLQSFVIAFVSFSLVALGGVLALNTQGLDSMAVGSRYGSSLIWMLAVRSLAFLAAYYSISGMAEHMGLLAHADRNTVARSASLMFALFGVIGLFFLPQLSLYAFLCAWAAASAIALGWFSSVLLLMALLLPAPLVMPLLSGRFPEVSAAFLYGSWRGTVLLSFMAAPLALWLSLGLSVGRSRVVRGRRTAFLFALGLPLAVLAETALLAVFG